MRVVLPFSDRRQAGSVLGVLLRDQGFGGDSVVLGLPRGGVPVAYEVARALGAPLDVFVVRKLGVPGHGELAMGAIATGGIRVLNDDVIGALGIQESAIERVSEIEGRELRRREIEYRSGRRPPDLRGRRAILIDDGLATGASMRAAVAAARGAGSSRVTVAVPVAPHQSCVELNAIADECVCAATPEPFYAVGLWYRNFDPITDDEVRTLMARANGEEADTAREADGAAQARSHTDTTQQPAGISQAGA